MNGSRSARGDDMRSNDGVTEVRDGARNLRDDAMNKRDCTMGVDNS